MEFDTNATQSKALSDLDNQVVTSARGVMKRRSTFGVLEVNRILGVNSQQLAQHELCR